MSHIMERCVALAACNRRTDAKHHFVYFNTRLEVNAFAYNISALPTAETLKLFYS